MRIIIGMECSGRIRRHFRDLGHDAWSCDYLPAEDGSPFHIQGSVFDHDTVNAGWDMGIFHPECTFSASSGARWMSIPWRNELQARTLAEFRSIMAMPIPGIAIENPPGRMSSLFRKPDQTVHPWWWGQRKLKPTCLWLKGLPKLVATDLIHPPRVKDMTPAERREWCEVHLASPGKNRGADRARTFDGIVRGFGQWGIAGIFTEETPIPGEFTKPQADLRQIEAFA